LRESKVWMPATPAEKILVDMLPFERVVPL
jgi:hypothetical protein